MRLEHDGILLRNAEESDCARLASWWYDGAVMAHVFTAEAREFYNLDRLFSDADRIEVESDIKGETEA